MRRRLLSVQPALAHWFNLMPWDYERLSPGELQGFVDAIPKPPKAKADPMQRRYGR